MRPVVLALLVLSPSSAVFAQSAPGDSSTNTEIDIARQLFEQGAAAIQARHYDEGLGFLQRSYALRPSASVSLQMGIALQELGRLVEATERFQDFLRLASPSLQERYGSEVAERMTTIGGHLGHLLVRELEPESARILVDTHTVAIDTSHDIAVDPGEHIVADERGTHAAVAACPGC